MEEMAFAKERSFKRKLMKTQVVIAGSGSGGGGSNESVSDQVRRVHILYYLSRNGCMEQPHLIRIHHLSRNGVHLRDVKSWLSELRGKDMPQSFAWSYKRRYKGGYVWQDLLDEDLITPLCDNEYVLKGSEISSTTLNNDINSYGEKEDFDLKKSSLFEDNTNDPKYPSKRKEYSLDFSTNSSIENQESSFGSNVTTEDTTRNQDEYKQDQSLQNPNDKNKNKNNQFSNNNISKNNNDDMNDNNSTNSKIKKGDDSTDCFEAPRSPTRKSGRASLMFRNWITCGTANTHEKALVVINKRRGSASSAVSSVSENNNGKENDMGRICKEQKLRGFEKSFDTRDGSKKCKKEESNNFKTFAAAYKPVNGPNCSQCGRQFRPEKLHNHMRYCRGMKAMAKSANTRPKPKISRPHSPSSKSFDTFYLTNN